MAEITAALVKELREKTGAGMMDCKKALGETERRPGGGRSTGCARRAWRRPPRRPAASPPKAWSASPPTAPRGAVVEVNAETDFVARNEHVPGASSRRIAAWRSQRAAISRR